MIGGVVVKCGDRFFALTEVHSFFLLSLAKQNYFMHEKINYLKSVFTILVIFFCSLREGQDFFFFFSLIVH